MGIQIGEVNLAHPAAPQYFSDYSSHPGLDMAQVVILVLTNIEETWLACFVQVSAVFYSGHAISLKLVLDLIIGGVD